jgi:hypothetical protein
MANGVLQPQPNPWNPRLFRVVPWQPRRERLRWNLLIGLRYRATILLYTPRALLYGLMHPKIELLGDHDFE